MLAYVDHDSHIFIFTIALQHNSFVSGPFDSTFCARILEKNYLYLCYLWGCKTPYAEIFGTDVRSDTSIHACCYSFKTVEIHAATRSKRRTGVATLTRSSAIADGPRDASCQLKSCQLPRNSAETTCTTSPEQIEVMKLEGWGGPMCNKHVHSTVTCSSHFHCLIGVINKPTTVWLCISPIYRRLVVAKFSKSKM